MLFAALTIALTFVNGAVGGLYGPRVAARFLERNTRYTVDDVKAFVESDARAAAGYVWPVLFPLDVVFLASLAAFIAVGSGALLDALQAPHAYRFAALLLPAGYFAADLLEDIALALMLMSATWRTAGFIRLTQVVTGTKVITATLAILQITALSLVGLWKGR
jgi:hypothetical protein